MSRDLPSGFESLEDLATEALKNAGEEQSTPLVLTICFMDLAGSTAAKLRDGNLSASKSARAFTNLASALVLEAGGKVVKLLGDGVLASFSDPIAACTAALKVRFATTEYLRLEMKAGISIGRPIRFGLSSKRFDLLGDVVDRAARIESLAMSGQILIDEPLHSQIRASMPELPWTISHTPRKAFAKGVGELALYELAVQGSWTLKGQLATPFHIFASGRPSLAEKLSLMDNAKHEIIEIGAGLTSFGRYFTGQQPSEFRDPIREIIRRGVEFRCFGADFTYSPASEWLGPGGDERYVRDAATSEELIEDEARHCRDNNFRGTLEYFKYRRIPNMWCLGVDVDDPVNGRMMFAPYLAGVARSATPAVQVSRLSNLQLFEKYLDTVNEIREASNEPQRHR